MHMNVIDFDTYFEKWCVAKRKRYSLLKMKKGYILYDNFKFDVAKNSPVIEEEREAKKEKEKWNKEWVCRLEKIIEKRKKNPEIWEPMFSLEELGD